MIYDGTNGVFLNVGIRIRDQVRFPTAPDLMAVLAELADTGNSYIMLMYDIKKAHRRVPVLQEEWGRQACQVRGSAVSSALSRVSRETRPFIAEGDGEARPAPLRKSDFTKEEIAETVYLNCVGTCGVASAGYWWAVSYTHLRAHET